MQRSARMQKSTDNRRAKRLVTVLAVTVALLALFFVVTQPSRAQDNAIPVPFSPPSAQAGEPLYQRNCAPCHGASGMGDGPTAPSLPAPPAHFANPATMWPLSPSELFSVTHNGRIEALMPPWGNQMTDLQIWNSVAYAWSLHTTEQELASGASLYAASCATCHGEAGAGDGPDTNEPMQDFTDQQWAIAQSQADLRSGWLAAHADIGADLLPDQQRALLEYIRSFSIASPWSEPVVTGDGSIAGTVTQGTSGGGEVEGLEATLGVWLGSERVTTFTTTVEGGRFAFPQLSTDPSLNYIVSIANQGVSYSSDLLSLSPLTPTVTGNIVVFDSTDDASVLRVDRMNWIIETLPQTLTIGQIYAVGNTSDRTYVGNRSDPDMPAPTFAMAIPDGATNLAFENGILGGRFVRQDDRVYDTLAVAPGAGTRQIILRFDFPYSGASATISQPLLYQTGELNLFVGDRPGLLVDASPLAPQGVQDIGTGAIYQLLTGASLAPQTIEVALDGLPTKPGDETSASGIDDIPGLTSTIPLPATTPLMPDWTVWLVAGVVAAALLGALVWSFTRSAQEESAASDAQRASLVDQIALIDDLHAQGALADDKWLAERTRLKQQILDLPPAGDERSF